MTRVENCQVFGMAGVKGGVQQKTGVEVPENTVCLDFILQVAETPCKSLNRE